MSAAGERIKFTASTFSHPRLFLIASLILLGVLFATSTYRVSTQGFSVNEARHLLPILRDHNHAGSLDQHTLDVVLSDVSIRTLGLSEFALRLPSVAGGLVYFLAILRLCRLLFGESWWLVLSVALNTLNPLILDYCSGGWGYSLGLALWAVGAYFIARWVTDGERVPILAGVALGLAVASSLAQIFAVAAIEIVFAAMVLTDRMIKGDRRGAARFTAWDGPLFVLATLAGALIVLWAPLRDTPPVLAAATELRYQDTLKSLAYVLAVYKTTFLTSLGRLSGLIVRTSWLLFPALFAGLAIAAASIARARLRAKNQTTVDRADRLVLLLGLTTLLGFLFLAIEPRLAHHRYFAPRGSFIMLPLIFTAGPLFLKWLGTRHDKARSLAIAGLVPLLLLLLNFALQFNLNSYYDAPADESTIAVVEFLRKSHAMNPDQHITIAADSSFYEALGYLMWRYRMSWMTVTDDLGAPGLDFVYLRDGQFDRLKGPGLREVLRDNATGAVLAQEMRP